MSVQPHMFSRGIVVDVIIPQPLEGGIDSRGEARFTLYIATCHWNHHQRGSPRGAAYSDWRTDYNLNRERRFEGWKVRHFGGDTCYLTVQRDCKRGGRSSTGQKRSKTPQVQKDSGGKTLYNRLLGVRNWPNPEQVPRMYLLQATDEPFASGYTL